MRESWDGQVDNEFALKSSDWSLAEVQALVHSLHLLSTRTIISG